MTWILFFLGFTICFVCERKNLKCLRGVVRNSWMIFRIRFFSLHQWLWLLQKREHLIERLVKKIHYAWSSSRIHIQKHLRFPPNLDWPKAIFNIYVKQNIGLFVAESHLNWQDIDGHIWDTNNIPVGKYIQTMCKIAMQGNVWSI